MNTEPHYYKTDVSWTGSGTDADPWIMTGWDVRSCTCDRPWRHAYAA